MEQHQQRLVALLRPLDGGLEVPLSGNVAQLGWRRSRTGLFTMKSQSSCAGPRVRELELRTGSADCDPAVLNTPEIVRSGNATQHFVPVP